jgi:DNA-binding HxlR family transcriptional regulator
MLLPVKDALDVLSGKWKLQIILSLSFGRKDLSRSSVKYQVSLRKYFQKS